eukprot:m.11910 g.11910  ORF g.11910 m.11910 type:complete len:338 (-) comp4553_c0_seq1:114-1127(-)
MAACRFRCPFSGVCLAILVGMALQDLRAEVGLKTRIRGAYYSVLQNTDLPFKTNITETMQERFEIDHTPDSFEYAAVAVALLSLLMGLVHGNLEEIQLPILLGGVLFLRAKYIVPHLANLLKKKANTGEVTEVRVFMCIMALALVTLLYVHMRGLQSNTGSFCYPVTALLLSLVLGFKVQDVIADNLSTSDWLYKGRYYKELNAANYGLDKTYEAMAALIAIALLYKLVRHRHIILDIVSWIPVGGAVFLYVEKFKPEVAMLKEISTKYKGTDQKAVRQEKCEEVLENLKQINVQMAGAIALALLLTFVACSVYTSKASDASKKKEDEKTTKVQRKG